MSTTRNFKLALLDAVPPDFSHVDGSASDGEKFAELLCHDQALLAHFNINVEYDIYHVADHQWPSDIASFDGVLISGSPASAHDNLDWINQLSKTVLEIHQRQQKLVGICFGHQLIAKTLGGTVSPNPESVGWFIGNQTLLLERTASFLSNVATGTETTIQHFNQERVTELPAQASSYLTHEALGIMGYTIGQHILTAQGHPEQSAAAMTKFLHYVAEHSENHENMLAEYLPQIESGIADNARWAKWIWQFYLEKAN